jgi:hypothetical protein
LPDLDLPSSEGSASAAHTGSALTGADIRGCRWIEGDPKPLRRGMYCGLPVAPGESWCAAHRGVVFGGQTITSSDPMR